MAKRKAIHNERWLDDDAESWLTEPDDILTDTDRARLAGCAPELLKACKDSAEFLDELCLALAKRGIFIESLLPESRMGFGSKLLTMIARAEGK